MANQQFQQNQQNKNPYEALDEIGKKVVDLKLSGLRYDHIVGYLEKLGQKRENQSVREWFIEGGKYFKAYQFMKTKKKEEVEPEFEGIQETIKEGAIDAIYVVRQQIAKGNLKAAMYMLKLAGLEVDQVRNLNSDSEGIALLREILERSEKKHGQQSSPADQIIQS